jgi:hypothetical protein
MRRTLFAVILLSICLFLQTGFGQTITASITGTVTDPSGAIVPSVKVTATNTSTNQAYSANTNESGVFNLLFLPVGNYNVATEIQGFKKTVLGPFSLQVNQIARVDIKLEVGATTESVEIRDFAPVLQTESTATGDTLESTKLTSIPLNGRNYASLLQLMPGAVSTSPNAMNTSNRFQGSGSRPQVNGNREQTNNFLLDGIDVNDSIDNRIGYNPNVDALEEVKVVTGNGSSEWGNAGGAIVNATIKSGTNEYHGNAFEFLRNDKLDANGYFNNRTNTKRNALKRNIFGGTFGGPIVRNKAFFFVDYEGTEYRTGGPSSVSVAPASWRTGDLSDILTKSKLQAVDPLTGPDIASRTQFPNNQIPLSRITNPVAIKLFSSAALYPLPNNPGTGALGVSSNYLGSTGNKTSNHQGDAKVDYRPNEKDSYMARWSMGRYDQGGTLNPLVEQLPGGTYGPTQSAMANWTRTISTTIVNEARVGFSRIGIDDIVIDWSGQLGADGNSKFGIPGGQPIAGLSSIALGNSLTSIGGAATIGSTRDNKFTYSDNLTWQRGAHLLKMGGLAIRYQQNRYYAGNNGALGTFTYDGTYSNVAFADFLMNDLVSKGRGAVVGKWGHRHWLSGLFVQDDWKATRNFTVNVGMRWEYSQPIYEVADRQVNINVFTGKLLYAGKDGNSRALYDPYYKQFEPRIGFAWNPKQKLVFRMGYAMSSFLEGTGANLRLPLNPPFFTESNVNYDPRTPGDIKTGFTDVIGAGNLASPRTTSTPFYQGRAWETNLRPQFTQQYNAAIEYQISATASLNVAYVGQLGTHLVVPHEANNPIAGTGPVASWTPSNDRRPLYLNGSLPNVGNIALTESSARMSYNSLQVTGRKRMSSGLEFLTTYTWSKSIMENLGYYGCGSVNAEGAYWQDAYNRLGNRGPACFDAKNNFTLGGLYDMPFGKGKTFGSGWNRATDLILGGWNVNFFSSAHSGFPVTVFASSANTGGRTPRGNVRANAYKPYAIPSQNVDQFYGAVTAASFCAAGVNDGSCAFGIPAVGSLGSAGVGTMRAPSFFNLDGSIGKKFYVREKQYIDFRVEFFNLFNHASWGAPGRDITNPGAFGQITTQIQNPRNTQFGLKYYF